MTTKPSTEDQQQLQQRYTGAYTEFIKKRQKAAKAAYLQMRHNLIERAIQESETLNREL